MTCPNCKKLERKNKQLRAKVENMERVREIHLAQIEENSGRCQDAMLSIDYMLDRVKEHIRDLMGEYR